VGSIPHAATRVRGTRQECDEVNSAVPLPDSGMSGRCLLSVGKWVRGGHHRKGGLRVLPTRAYRADDDVGPLADRALRPREAMGRVGPIWFIADAMNVSDARRSGAPRWR
jgi:hypothetical protein